MPFLKITAAFPSSQRRSRRLQQIEEDRVDGKMTELLQDRPRHVSLQRKNMKNLSTTPAFPSLILASCQSPDRTAIRTVAKGDSAEHDGSAAGATVRRFHDRINFLHRQCHRAHPLCRLHALDRSDLHSQHGEVPLGYGLKTTRLTNPAAEIHELPPWTLFSSRIFMAITLTKWPSVI